MIQSQSNNIKYLLILILLILLISCQDSNIIENNVPVKKETFKTSVDIIVDGKLPLVNIPNTMIYKLPIDSKNSSYDQYFKKYTKQYFGLNFDYRWFKSQAYAESHLNLSATNPSGAKGIMQIMPLTYKEIQTQSGLYGDVLNAKWNIASGIYYNHKLFNTWSSSRTLFDRMMLTFASYNAGIGNILKAQKLCAIDCNKWNSIKNQAYNVNSWNCNETISYINQINNQLGYK